MQAKFDDVQGGYSNGTIPILREGEDPILNRISPKPHCTAGVRTTSNKNFYGSKAYVSAHKPVVATNQWSAARIKLSNGLESIEAGWMVYPSYFKDNEAHFYVKYKIGTVECFNTDCPGFIQQAQEIHLGSVPDRYSVVGGEPYVLCFSIDKHQDDGQWWLSLPLPNGDTQQIGYWPKTLFTSLQDGATQVEWGGEIDDPGAAEPAPSMGNGSKATYDQTLSAYFQLITVVDENFQSVNPDDTEEYCDCPKLYTVIDNEGHDQGRLIFYGGTT
ncbi:hypothetical protein vseg_016281 [Gypsophila vaccaria]